MKKIVSQLSFMSRADGKKMKPSIVLNKRKGTHLIKELQKIPGVVSFRGWMNDSLTADYLQKMIGVNIFSFGMHTSATSVTDIAWNTCFKRKLQYGVWATSKKLPCMHKAYYTTQSAYQVHVVRCKLYADHS